MPRTRRTKVSRKTAPKRQSLGLFTRARPFLITAAAMALGTAVGAFIRFTPEEKQSLDEQVGKLKERAGTLKNSVSELAVDGYARTKQAAMNALEVGSEKLDDETETPIPGAVKQSSLLMNVNGS